MKIIIIKIILILLIPIKEIYSQKDYYNTDHNQPLKTEDAYSIEKFGLEFRLSLFDLETQGDQFQNYITPEIKYSFIDNFHLGLGVKTEISKYSKIEFNGVKELELNAFYNFNRENLYIPSFALSAGYTYELNDNDNSSNINLKFIATRSFGKVRAHINSEWKTKVNEVKFNRENLSFGLALDYALPFSSLLLMGEIYNYSNNRSGLTLGLRKQINNSLLIYTGIGTEIGPERKNDVTFKLGFSIMKGLIF